MCRYLLSRSNFGSVTRENVLNFSYISNFGSWQKIYPKTVPKNNLSNVKLKFSSDRFFENRSKANNTILKRIEMNIHALNYYEIDLLYLIALQIIVRGSNFAWNWNWNCSELGTLKWDTFNPDCLIRISKVETFNFFLNPFFLDRVQKNQKTGFSIRESAPFFVY